MGALLWLLEAVLILFVSMGIALISATACIGATTLLTVMLWTFLEAHHMTPPYWTLLGVLQGIATVVVLLPHIRR
jgi:hypothetical protein